MSHTVEWYIPSRLIYLDIWGDVTLEEIEAVNAEVVRLLDQGDSPVHLLGRDQDVGKMPVNLRELQKRFTLVNHPTLGWIVGVGEVNPVLNFLFPMLMKIARVDFVRRLSLAGAEDFLKNNDMSLNWENVQPISSS